MASKTRRGRRQDARLSIIDISLEDDSLLPLYKGNNDAAMVMRGALDAEDAKEKDPHQADEMQVQLPEESDNKEEPQDPVDQQVRKSSQPSRPAFRRKKTSGHNSLRKSLAWDKAFLTGEGVLDPDELLSTRSPKRLPELPTFDVNARTTSTSNLPAGLDSDQSHGSRNDNKHVLVEEAKETAALNLRSCSERFDMGRWKEPVMSCIPEYPETASQKPQPNAVMSHLSGPSIPRPLPAKKVIESAIQKGTRLRLPSTFPTRNEDKQTVAHVMKQQNEKPPSTSSLTKRVSSVSRKVKDTLGKVLPGRSSNKHGSSVSMASSECSGRSTPTRVSAPQIKLLPETSITAAEATEGSSSAEISSAYSQSCHGVGVLSNVGEEHSTESGNRCLRSEDVAPKLSSRKDASYFRSNSTGSRLKPLLEESSSSRFKPTGLKMPSPKLGFFDPGRAFHAAQAVKSSTSTATTGRAARIDCSNNSTHYSSRPKPHGLPKGKSGNEPADPVSSAIPSAPHLRTAEKELKGIYQVTSAPSTPRKINNELLSPAAHFALSNASLTPKGKLNESRSSARKLGLGDEAQRACDQYVHEGVRAENGCTSSRNCDVRHPGERSARFNEEVFGRKALTGVPKLKHLEICTASMGICASQGEEQSEFSGIDQCFESRFASEPSGARQAEAKSEFGETCIDNSSVQPDQGVSLSTEIASRIGSSDSSSMMGLRTNSSENSGPEELFTSENSGAEELFKSSKLKSKTEQFDEDTSSHWSDWPVLARSLQSPQLGPHQVKLEKDKIVVLESDGAAKSPLAVNSALLNAGPNSEQQKEKGSFFAFAKKTVGLLSSPMQENTSGQENELGQPTRKHKRTWASDAADTRIHSSAENRSCTLEATREEKLVKTAPVQHSPPNKTEPQPGPWSPVRRNGVQLGPFDCTKSNAHAVGWDLP